MRRTLLLVLLAAAFLTAASPAHAQRYRTREYDRPRNLEGRTMATVHFGISSPTGDLGDFYDSGLGFGGSIGHGISQRVMLSLGVSHHEFDHETFNDQEVSITPVTLNVDYAFGTSNRLMPWVGGGIGMYQVSDQLEGFPDIDESSFGFNLGAGIAGPIARKTLLGAGFRYHSVSGDELPDSQFFTFQIGLGFFL
jgi:opacity protein-like surface antigen